MLHIAHKAQAFGSPRRVIMCHASNPNLQTCKICEICVAWFGMMRCMVPLENVICSEGKIQAHACDNLKFANISAVAMMPCTEKLLLSHPPFQPRCPCRRVAPYRKFKRIWGLCIYKARSLQCLTWWIAPHGLRMFPEKQKKDQWRMLYKQIISDYEWRSNGVQSSLPWRKVYAMPVFSLQRGKGKAWKA